VEIRVNLVLMAFLALVWLGLTAQMPAVIEGGHDLAQLGALEDAAARNPGDARVLVQLSERYLAQGLPLLAITTIRAADAVVLEEPAVAHQLARAYEHSGRLLDALATADLALVRCARVLGAKHYQAAVPSFVCNERTLATLDTHKGALERMVQWGVVDPRHDARAQRAYDLALRTARIAIGELPPTGTRN
jgi:hypothetical protein